VDRKSLEKAALHEVLRIVREVEAPRPSDRLSSSAKRPSIAAVRGMEPKKLSGSFRGELDWITMEALEKDRSRRYESANGFAADVLRYLSGEAVQAHPPSAGYRLKKFVRRNKGHVLATSLVFFALLAGMAGTTLGLLEAKQGRDDAVDARGKETIQRGIADTNANAAEIASAKAVAAEGVAVREKKAALAVAASSTMDRGQLLCESGDTIRGLDVICKALAPAVESGDAVLEEAVRFAIAAWMPHTPRLLGRIQSDSMAVCLSPDGRVLVGAGMSGQLHFWDTQTLRRVARDVPLGGGRILKVTPVLPPRSGGSTRESPSTTSLSRGVVCWFLPRFFGVGHGGGRKVVPHQPGRYLDADRVAPHCRCESPRVGGFSAWRRTDRRY